MITDPYGTQSLRNAVLDAWVRSPARFREDANAEEDHAGGYYRDRVIVELAQNAADAATRGGDPGRLELRLLDRPGGGAVLLAGNTGQPLDAAGVASLASLRASAKLDAQLTVGRFGVGFAAVRSVSDDIWVFSGPSDQGVRFCLGLTRETVEPLPELTDQVTARGSALPVLRLPFAVTRSDLSTWSAGFEALAEMLDRCPTVVVLGLRDATAREAVRAQLDEIDDAFLLALDALAEITVEVPGAAVRTLRDVASRWVTVRRSGELPAALLAARPVEERGRTTWSVLWAVPATGQAVLGSVVRAPTPTVDPLSFPALLVASFPLDPSRRHVAEDPLADWLANRAGEAYAALVPLVEHPLALVPTGLPSGRLDAMLREAALAALRGAAMIDGRLPADVVMIDGEIPDELVTALRPTGLGVAAVPRQFRAAARALGVQVRSVADLVDALPAGLTPAQWRALYAALEPLAIDSSVREALNAIIVPLADGSTVRGPRGVLLPADGVAAEVVVDGLRVVHPDAVHPGLLRWGALQADDPQVLELAAVETAVRVVGDELIGQPVDARDDDFGGFRRPVDAVRALLALLSGVARAHGRQRGDLPSWWSGLALPGDDGRWHEARDLVWPDSWANANLDLPVVEADGIVVLSAELADVLGVRTGLTVTAFEHDTGIPDSPDVAGWADYDEYLCAVFGAGVSVGELPVVPDLDVVFDDSWGAVVETIANSPDLRAALLTPVRGRPQPGPAVDLTCTEAISYVAWFLRDLFGSPFAGPGLDGVLPLVPDDLMGVGDPQVLRALGILSEASDVEAYLRVADPGTWDDFLAALQDAANGVPGTPIPLPIARSVWSALQTAAAAGLELDPLPEVMVALWGNAARLVAAADLAVTADPMWAQVRAVVPVGRGREADVAHALDCIVLDPAMAHVQIAEVARKVGSPGVGADGQDSQDGSRLMPSAVQALVTGVPERWLAHPELIVDGVEVDWWVAADGSVHVRAEAGLPAVAQACAQAAGAWDARFLIEVLLSAPGRAAEVAAQAAW